MLALKSPRKETTPMKTQVCFEELSTGYPVRLLQTGIDRFTVEYGKQIKRGLNYGDAAKELGLCLMHLCACEGRLDNHERGER
jgi:hypothetical protein